MMSRLQLIIVLVAVSTYWQGVTCHWHHLKNYDPLTGGPQHHSFTHHDHTEWIRNTLFPEIAADVKAVNKRLKLYCDKFTANKVSTYFDSENRYTLKLKVPEGLGNEEIEVKLKNGVVLIDVHPKDKSATYLDLKVLPGGVNGPEGKWYLQEELLLVVFPYDTKESKSEICSLDETETVIPRLQSPPISMYARFGDVQ